MLEETLVQANRILAKINEREKTLALLDYPRLKLVAQSQSGVQEEINISETLRERIRTITKEATTAQLDKSKVNFAAL